MEEKSKMVVLLRALQVVSREIQIYHQIEEGKEEKSEEWMRLKLLAEMIQEQISREDTGHSTG